MILGIHKLLIIFLTCIGILVVQPHTVSGIRNIRIEPRSNHRMLKEVAMENHKVNPSSTDLNKKFDSYQSSKRRVGRGSDPIHNRA